MLVVCGKGHTMFCFDSPCRMLGCVGVYESLLGCAYLFCFAHVSFKPTVLLNTGCSAEESVSAMK